MDVKEAVARARAFVFEVFGAEEAIVHLALEEVERDDPSGWLVTLGFDRPWGPTGAITALMGKPGSNGNRVYRVVNVRDDGEVVSVKQRDPVGG